MTDQQEPKSCVIGEVLREAREQRGMSVREVGRKLKLPSSIVTTIESNRLDQLAPIYRRGYVVNYARLLEIDPASLCEELDHRDNDPPELQEVLQTAQGAWRFERYLRVATYVFTTAFIAIPLIWIFVKVAADIFESNDPATRVAISEQAPPDETRVSQRLERLAQSLGDLAGDEQPETQHLSASTMPILNLLTSPGQQEPAAAESGIGPLRDTSDTDTPPHAVPGANELVVEVGNACWVEIRDATGQRMEYDLLHTGRHVYYGVAPFEVMLGRAGEVTITVDGRPADFTDRIRADVARFELAADGSIRS